MNPYREAADILTQKRIEVAGSNSGAWVFLDHAATHCTTVAHTQEVAEFDRQFRPPKKCWWKPFREVSA